MDDSESRLYELMKVVASGQAASNAKIDSILARLDRHESAIFGNGSEGLRQRVASIEQRSKDAERASARRLKIILGSFTLINVAVSIVFYVL